MAEAALRNLIGLLPEPIMRPMRSLRQRFEARRVSQLQIERANTREIVLSFGECLPQSESAARGGRVKLLHLAKEFHHSDSKFNLLYLVSSGRPRAAVEWIHLAKRHNIKVVWNQNGVAYPAWAGAEVSSINNPLAECLGLADYVIYQSKFCKLASETLLKARPPAQSIIYNCVDIEKFTPAAAPPALEGCRLLVMGTQNSAARVLLALETLAELRASKINARLTIAGALNWPLAQAQVKSLIETLSLHDHVTLLGAFPHTKSAEILRAHHVLLHLQFQDNCPTIVLEALACGLPVVALDNGGVPELVNSACGICLKSPPSWEVIELPNAALAASAVRAILPSWAKYSKAARQHALVNFSQQNWLAQHRDIFKSLVSAS